MIYNDRIVLVTGGTSGLGAHFVSMLRQNGATVISAGRNIPTSDPYARYLDVTNIENIKQVVNEIESTIGPIDTLINCAGTGSDTYADKVSEQEFDVVMDTNVKGTFFVTQEVGKKMIERKTGTIINITSIVDVRILSNISVYSMSKAAITQMTKSLAYEWGQHGINVNAIAPGYFYTQMTKDVLDSRLGKFIINNLPRKRVGNPEDLDSAIHMLMDPKNRMMNGSVITVDDGASL